MKTSETITEIAAALVKAQQAIGAVTKDKTAKIAAGREYHYSDLSSVIAACKPPLNDNGITFLQAVGGDSTGVLVTTTLLHISGQWIEATVYLPVPQATAQAYGSGFTYAKRYGLQSLVGMPSEDDDGAEATKAAEPTGPTETEVALAKSLLAGAKTLDALTKSFTSLPVALQKLVRDDASKRKADFMAAAEA